MADSIADLRGRAQAALYAIIHIPSVLREVRRAWLYVINRNKSYAGSLPNMKAYIDAAFLQGATFNDQETNWHGLIAVPTLHIGETKYDAIYFRCKLPGQDISEFYNEMRARLKNMSDDTLDKIYEIAEDRADVLRTIQAAVYQNESNWEFYWLWLRLLYKVENMARGSNYKVIHAKKRDAVGIELLPKLEHDGKIIATFIFVRAPFMEKIKAARQKLIADTLEILSWPERKAKAKDIARQLCVPTESSGNQWIDTLTTFAKSINGTYQIDERPYGAVLIPRLHSDDINWPEVRLSPISYQITVSDNDEDTAKSITEFCRSMKLRVKTISGGARVALRAFSDAIVHNEPCVTKLSDELQTIVYGFYDNIAKVQYELHNRTVFANPINEADVFPTYIIKPKDALVQQSSIISTSYSFEALKILREAAVKEVTEHGNPFVLQNSFQASLTNDERDFWGYPALKTYHDAIRQSTKVSFSKIVSVYGPTAVPAIQNTETGDILLDPVALDIARRFKPGDTDSVRIDYFQKKYADMTKIVAAMTPAQLSVLRQYDFTGWSWTTFSPLNALQSINMVLVSTRPAGVKVDDTMFFMERLYYTLLAWQAEFPLRNIRPYLEPPVPNVYSVYFPGIEIDGTKVVPVGTVVAALPENVRRAQTILMNVVDNAGKSWAQKREDAANIIRQFINDKEILENNVHYQAVQTIDTFKRSINATSTFSPSSPSELCVYPALSVNGRGWPSGVYKMDLDVVKDDQTNINVIQFWYNRVKVESADYLDDAATYSSRVANATGSVVFYRRVYEDCIDRFYGQLHVFGKTHTVTIGSLEAGCILPSVIYTHGGFSHVFEALRKPSNVSPFIQRNDKMISVVYSTPASQTKYEKTINDILISAGMHPVTVSDSSSTIDDPLVYVRVGTSGSRADRNVGAGRRLLETHPSMIFVTYRPDNAMSLISNEFEFLVSEYATDRDAKNNATKQALQQKIKETASITGALYTPVLHNAGIPKTKVEPVSYWKTHPSVDITSTFLEKAPAVPQKELVDLLDMSSNAAPALLSSTASFEKTPSTSAIANISSNAVPPKEILNAELSAIIQAVYDAVNAIKYGTSFIKLLNMRRWISSMKRGSTDTTAPERVALWEQCRVILTNAELLEKGVELDWTQFKQHGSIIFPACMLNGKVLSGCIYNHFVTVDNINTMDLYIHTEDTDLFQLYRDSWNTPNTVGELYIYRQTLIAKNVSVDDNGDASQALSEQLKDVSKFMGPIDVTDMSKRWDLVFPAITINGTCLFDAIPVTGFPYDILRVVDGIYRVAQTPAGLVALQKQCFTQFVLADELLKVKAAFYAKYIQKLNEILVKIEQIPKPPQTETQF